MMKPLSTFNGKMLTLFVCFAFMPLYGLLAQENVKESKEYTKYVSMYQKAKNYNDLGVAKTALYNLMVLDPKNISLLDSLALMYFEFQQYPSSLLVSRDILASNPDNLAALEISAISYEQLGIRDRALQAYESLYLKNNNINTLYKIAFLQYDLNRLEQSMTTADIILNKEEAKELKIIYTLKGNEQLEVPMKAAILNLKGMINKKQGDKEKAKANFEEALALAPKFALAKQNIEQLSSAE